MISGAARLKLPTHQLPHPPTEHSILQSCYIPCTPQATMATNPLPLNPQISPADRQDILAKIALLSPNSLNLEESKPNETPRRSDPSLEVPVPATKGSGRAVQSRQTHVKHTPKIGDGTCRICLGSTQHSCVQCLFACHNPANSWTDSFGMQQYCSIHDAGGDEAAFL